MQNADEQLQRVQRSDARRNRRAILEAATRAVADNGTQASLRDVARRAGVGLGTLYRHFPTRDDLLQAVLSDALDRLVARADELAESQTPRSALVTWLEEFTLGATTFSGLPASLVAALSNPQSALFAPCSRMTAGVGRLLSTAQQHGVVRNDITATDLIALAGAIATINEVDPPSTQRLTHLLSIRSTASIPHPQEKPRTQPSPVERDSAHPSPTEMPNCAGLVRFRERCSKSSFAASEVDRDAVRQRRVTRVRQPCRSRHPWERLSCP